MAPRWYIGLSSGSCLAGVDAALVRIDGSGAALAPHLEHFVHEPHSGGVREFLLRVSGEAQPRQLCLAHRVVGEAFANVARKVAEQGKHHLHQILAVGMSGHTVWHDAGGRFPSTLNLGMPAAVAERTGLTVISDFRSRDLVVGGQGQPLTSVVDAMVFQNDHERRVLIHLGGVASVLWLDARNSSTHAAVPRKLEDSPPGLACIALQAAPCMLILDGLMRLATAGRESFDPGGRYAVQGRCLEALVRRWLAHPLFKHKPPRTVPVDEFGPEFLAQAVELAKREGGTLHDLLCSATHFVARAVGEAIGRFLPGTPDRVLVSGGGVRNGLLWRLLEQLLAPVPMERIDRFGVPAESREALAFAGLAALAMDGVPGNVPENTGAAGPRLLGSFTPGSSTNWARCLAWMAAQTAHLRRAA